MLSKEEFRSWGARLNLSPEAQSVVARIRCAEPARRVGGGHHNVSGRYPSRKMGVTIQFESHRVELAFIYQMEHDDTVLEYYDQPPSIRLEYKAANGKHLKVWHTPDFFVIRRDSAGWEECKTESELKKLAEKSPYRYEQESGGRWRCSPGKAYAAQFGLYYEFRSSAEINWTFQRNAQFLEDYWRFEVSPASPAVRQRVRDEVASCPGLCLSDLFARTTVIASRDDIYRLITAGDLYVDLQAAALVESDTVRVYANREAATASKAVETCVRTVDPPPFVRIAVGSSITWDSKVWKIVNLGERRVSLLEEGGAFTEIPLDTFEGLVRESRIAAVKGDDSSGLQALRFLPAASEDDLKVANRRYELVQRRINGAPFPEEAAVAGRTLRLWIARYKQAKEQYGSGYVGLIPKTGQRGNRSHKLSAESQTLLDEFITKDYETFKQKSRFASWAGLLRKADEKGVRAPSYVTFCRAVIRRPRFDQTLKRQGRRAAYQHEPFYWELTQTTPRHGDRPLEIGHIDHTQLDVEVVSSHINRVLGRPWITLLTDAFSRRFLTFYLTFDEPSYRSCMMALRECVRRHGRLPQITILDGGPEFKSTYLETLVARYQCTKKTRPRAKGRFGSVVERLIGTTNTQFIYNLRGNTQITRNVRQVTKSVDPKELATWTLGELHIWLSEYLYEVYDTIDHPALGESPREAFQAGLEAFGFRPECRIPYNQDFIIATLPAGPKRTAKVMTGRGVKVNHIYYWSDSFRDPAAEGQRVPVRYDPFDVATAYAYVGRHWVECHSEYYAVFRGRSEKELMLVSSEIRRRQQHHSQGFALTARRLGVFLESIEAEEILLMQRLRDREARTTRECVPTVPPTSPGPEKIRQEEASHEDRPAEPESPLTEGEIYGAF